MIKDSLSNRLKFILKLRGVTQAELARATTISKSMVTAYIKGYYSPKQSTITLFSEYLNVNEAWLMGYDVPMERAKVVERIKDDENDLLIASLEELSDEQKELIKSMIKQFTKKDN